MVRGLAQWFVGFRMVRGFSQWFLGLRKGSWDSAMFMGLSNGLCAFAKVRGPRNGSNHIRTCKTTENNIKHAPAPYEWNKLIVNTMQSTWTYATQPAWNKPCNSNLKYEYSFQINQQSLIVYQGVAQQYTLGTGWLLIRSEIVGPSINQCIAIQIKSLNEC